jgi:predicted GNAT family N-acyltransferase
LGDGYDRDGVRCSRFINAGSSGFYRAGRLKRHRKAESARERERMASTTKILAIQSTDPLMAGALALRRDIFVLEQHVPPELEVDDDDKAATHLVALAEGRVIGTLRILVHGRTAKIGRMAVSAASRKQGIGRQLMEYAALKLAREGVEEIALAAQVTARDFYKRLGYAEKGPAFDDAGIPHVLMRKSLQTEQ